MVNVHEINEIIFPGFGMESIWLWVIFHVTKNIQIFPGNGRGSQKC